MTESSQLKRQISIFGLILTNQDNIYRNEDLASYFGVSIPTIDRDLRELRIWGIDIHSSAKKGLRIHREIEPWVTRGLLMQYLTMNYTEYFDKHIETMFAFEDKERALGIITTLQNAIDRCLIVNLVLKEDHKVSLHGFRYEPRLIFNSDNEWKLLISDHKDFKIIPVKAIDRVRTTETGYNEINKDILIQEINKITNKNVSNKKYRIKLEFSRLDENTIPRSLAKVNIYRINENGSAVFEAEIDSMDDIAGWIFTQGKNLLTIEPPELASEIFKRLKEMNRLFVKEKDIFYSMEIETKSKIKSSPKNKINNQAMFETGKEYGKMDNKNMICESRGSFSQPDIDTEIAEALRKIELQKLMFDFEIFTN